MHFLYRKLSNLPFDLNFIEVVPNDPVDNMSELLPMIARCGKDGKPLAKQTMTKFINIFMRHPAPMC